MPIQTPSRSLGFRAACLSAGLVLQPLRSQQPPVKPLADLSLEDLLNIEVTSVSKKPEKASEAPAAVFVITRDDIRRSGAVSVPQALRLAPNLEVAQVDAFTWAISARGFNSNNGNKLLVLIDGRTVYSPIFSGVWWDAQDVVLEDIDRIEVISGSGGTLWGSNAVDGVINIITRKAGETQGVMVKGVAGKGPQSGAVQAGFKAPWGGAMRVYAKSTSQQDSELQSGVSAKDGWHAGQAGFRGDWGSPGNALTIQGDAYNNILARLPNGSGVADGVNLLGRWERDWSPDEALQVQVYGDRVSRKIPTLLGVRTDTLDLDVQGRFKLGSRNAIVWGGGYRSMDNAAENSAAVAILPARFTLALSNVFIQDTLSLVPDKVDLVLGEKLEHNDFTGTESLPDARLSWKFAPGQMVWAAAARAVRTPAILDTREFVPGGPPFLLGGGPTFESEIVKTYEAGYKLQTPSGFSLSVSPFYNQYEKLRGLGPDPTGHSVFAYVNDAEGDGWGAELWADIPVTSWWKLKPAYSYLRQDLRFIPGSHDLFPTPQAGNDPRHRILLTSLLSPEPWLDLDFTLRHASELPSPKVPAYTTMDARVGWKPRTGLEIALIGQSLFQPQHWEAASPQTGAAIARALLVSVTWTF